MIKPAVSAGSRDTGRYDLAHPGQRAFAVALVERLHATGRVVMIQPYLTAAGEPAARVGCAGPSRRRSQDFVRVFRHRLCGPCL